MSNFYSIEYSAEAKKDLKEIYSYIAFTLLASTNAKNQVNRIRNTICSLDFMPSRNPIIDWEPWKSIKMHKISVDNFIIFYTVDEIHFIVTIIRIVYKGQNVLNIITDSKS